MNFLSSILLIKKLPNYKLVIFLIIFSGICEAFGISVLVPVVTSLIGESSNNRSSFRLLTKVLKFHRIIPQFKLDSSFCIYCNDLIFFCGLYSKRVLAISRYKFLARIRNEASQICRFQWEYLKNFFRELSNKLLVESERAANLLWQ